MENTRIPNIHHEDWFTLFIWNVIISFNYHDCTFLRNFCKLNYYIYQHYRKLLLHCWKKPYLLPTALVCQPLYLWHVLVFFRIHSTSILDNDMQNRSLTQIDQQQSPLIKWITAFHICIFSFAWLLNIAYVDNDIQTKSVTQIDQQQAQLIR